MADFSIKGLDGLTADIKAVAREYPAEVEKHLKRVGDSFKKKVIAATPDSGHKHPHKLNKSWRSNVEGLTVDTLEYQLSNVAGHFPLVERGHRKLSKKGKVIGYVQGRHFFEKACDEFHASDEMGKEMDRFVREIKRKIEHD
jgi:hypothetical protein